MTKQKTIEKLMSLAYHSTNNHESKAALQKADKLRKDKKVKQLMLPPIEKSPKNHRQFKVRLHQVKVNLPQFFLRPKRLFIRSKFERSVIKIIPHKSLANNMTRRLQASLFDLFSVSEESKKWPWQHRQGFYVALQPKPDFWWVVKMETDDQEKRRIEFYISMPKNFLGSFKTKFRNHEKWKTSTLKEIPSDEFKFPEEENTDLYRLKYRRHDMFSLKYDYSEQEYPIRDIMSVSNELGKGESLNLFIRCEPLNRKKWKGLTEYGWEVWKKGDIAYRPGLDPTKAVETIFSGIYSLFFEVKSLSAEVMNGLKKSLMANKAGEEDLIDTSKKKKLPNRDREDLLLNSNSGKLSTRTSSKRNLPAYNTTILCSVTSEDPIKRGMLARSVENSFRDMSEDNELKAVKVNVGFKKELNDLKNWIVRDRDPNRMSIDEVGKLQQLPTPSLQLEFQDALESNQRTETNIEKPFLESSGILVGTATERGTVHNVHIPTKKEDFLFTPRFFCGSPRMGKDQAAINLVVESALKHNIGAVIPDVIDEKNGHRGMADALRDHLPPERVLDFDLGDTENPIYLGLQSLTKNIPDLRIAADRIAEEITQFLMDEEPGEKLQTEDFLREAAKVTLGAPLDIQLMFQSRTFRDQKVTELGDLFDMDIWEDYNRMKPGKQAMIYGPVMRRLGTIINSEFLKPLFCQEPNPEMDLYKWIDEGKIIILRIPNRMLSERQVQILVYWIVLNVFLVRLAMGGRSKSRGTILVLNEPHQFMSDGLVHFMERMFAEGPKYKLMPVVLFHHFAQFRSHPGLVDAMISASGNWHLFKNTNSAVYEKLMFLLNKTFETTQQAFDATRAYQYISCWLTPAGEYGTPFIADALPMVGDRYSSQDNSFLSKQQARKYGRPIMEVMREIKIKKRMIYQESPDEDAQ